MQPQYTLLGYRVDLYFHKYKLAIEVDELAHNDRNIDYKIQRQKALERVCVRLFNKIKVLKIDCKKNTSHIIKMHIYCKKCNKHTGNTYTKKIILISKNKIKGKSKCAICLTERTFIDEIEGDLERELEIYLQFFTD